MSRGDGIIDPEHTVPELVERMGYPLEAAIAVRAFGRWLELMGPPSPFERRSAVERVKARADELGVDYYRLEAALVAYASGHDGAARKLLELLSEPLE